jgi:hypothetical protein
VEVVEAMVVESGVEEARWGEKDFSICIEVVIFKFNSCIPLPRIPACLPVCICVFVCVLYAISTVFHNASAAAFACLLVMDRVASMPNPLRACLQAIASPSCPAACHSSSSRPLPRGTRRT